VPTVWLAFLGASIASAGTGADPSDLVAAAFGVMTIPVLLIIMHGPVATNILNIYSASLSALSLDLKVKRWQVSIAASIVGSIALIAFVESESFARSFDNWMVSIIVWISAWAGVMLVDYYLFRRGRVDVGELYAPPETSRYGDVNWIAIGAMLAGLVAGWAWEYGLVEEFQGPIAKATNNIDLSWLAGLVVSGGLYYAFSPLRQRQPRPARAGV
jgi:NCS1 family nucleobase:cation symporter-1